MASTSSQIYNILPVNTLTGPTKTTTPSYVPKIGGGLLAGSSTGTVNTTPKTIIPPVVSQNKIVSGSSAPRKQAAVTTVKANNLLNTINGSGSTYDPSEILGLNLPTTPAPAANTQNSSSVIDNQPVVNNPNQNVNTNPLPSLNSQITAAPAVNIPTPQAPVDFNTTPEGQAALQKQNDAQTKYESALKNNFTADEQQQIIDAGKDSGLPYDVLIQKAQAEKEAGMAVSTIAAGERGGFMNTQFAGQAALTPINGGNFEGNGGQLNKLKSEYDSNIDSLNIQKQQAITQAKEAAKKAIQTGDATLLQLAQDAYNQAQTHQQNIAEATRQYISDLQNTAQFNQTQQANQLAMAQNIAQTYAPSIIGTDASGNPVIPTDQQIINLAQQENVDPNILKSEINRQVQTMQQNALAQKTSQLSYAEQVAQSYGPSLITYDDLGNPTAPTDAQINALAQQKGVDPQVLKTAINKSVQDAQKAQASIIKSQYSNLSAKGKDYAYYVEQEQAAGRTPLDYLSFYKQSSSKSSLSSEDISNIANQLINGSVAPSQLPKNTDTTRIIAEAQKRNPNFNFANAEAEWKAAQQFTKTKNSQQTQNKIAAITSVTGGLGELSRINEEFKRSNVQWVNKKELELLAKTGNTTASKFITQINLLTDELGSAFMGGAGSITDKALDLAKSVLNSNYSHDQLESTIDQLKTNLNIRLNALTSQNIVSPGGGIEGGVSGGGTDQSSSGGQWDW